MKTDTLPIKLYPLKIDGRTRRRIRTDALANMARYKDGGCEYSPSCLTCPLAVCKHDVGVEALRIARRDDEITELRGDGASIKSLMERFAISRRAVYRILAKARAA